MTVFDTAAVAAQITDATPLTFRRHIDVHVVANEAVFLVCENGVSVLDGRLAAKLGELIDGTRSLLDIQIELAGQFPAERLAKAVGRIVDRGLVTGVTPATDPRAAGFFELGGIDGDRAIATLTAARVRIETYGDVDATALCEALATVGVNPVDTEPDLVVALVDDYLQPGLAERNADALRERRPWLLARPSGPSIWIGPVFVPGETACWSCLATRIEANRQSMTYLQQKLDEAVPLTPSRPRLSVAAGAGAHLVATEIARWLVGLRPERASVLTFNALTFAFETHELVRRPQCAECGDPSLQAAQGLRPLVLQPRRKVFSADGGHRATTPEDMLEQYRRQLSPITGVVTGLTPAASTPDGVRVYVSGQNLARQVRDLRHLRLGLRSLSAGKGKTDVQARASAMGEAMERYSGVFRGDEARRLTTFDDLGDAAIDPRDVMLYSERQYARGGMARDVDAVSSTFHAVPAPFDPARRVDWSPVWSLTEQRQRWLPTSYLYFNTPVPNPFAFADSNGNAGGTSLEDATLQGFFELVERDAVALWWYNRVQRPAIDLDAFGDPYVDKLRTIYAAGNREIWALDLTTDLGVPAVGAISRRIDKPQEDILIAFGAHFDPHIALTRALTELNQFWGPAQLRDDGSYEGNDPEHVHWWQTATLADQPYLAGDPRVAASGPGRWHNHSTDDLAADIDVARFIVESHGMQLLVLDQTRPDVGLPVVKVIVPGLRHFWDRFAAGRLYDVPVALGWLDKPTGEPDLNPIPIFI
jgi:bacteriocin biosynthesis cyclodehydratase domain-containing protein